MFGSLIIGAFSFFPLFFMKSHTFGSEVAI